MSSALVGDGGASWRLKALKRAEELAIREGRNLQEVVEERWGSMGRFAASVACRDVAPTRAHLRAIEKRRIGLMKEQKNLNEENINSEKDIYQKSKKDILTQHRKMEMPRLHYSSSWGKRGHELSAKDSVLVSAAMSNLNRFSDDGNFMAEFMTKEEKRRDPSITSNFEARAESTSVDFTSKENKEKQNAGTKSRLQIAGATSRFIIHDVSVKRKRKEDDADLHLAHKITHNHLYNISNQADGEYEYDNGPRKNSQKKRGGDHHEITNTANRILTQQERCHSCFENPVRSKHLVIAIANFTYLSLPHQHPVVPGHCCILTLQHESSTRTVDDNVWTEIRNFKKCLIMMFAKQEKDLVFFETVIELAQQRRRHCLIECIPLPRDIARQAPLYFKKAIDEAEDEWSQHNAKKLIDTSEKGLRGSIPQNFPYFHVEFGLSRGFVHVIDDEKEFRNSFGLNVIRGMLKLPAEDMHRRSRHQSDETQNRALASFAKDWETFDWTKQL